MTDKAARRVAAAASRLSRRQAEHVARPVERAIIRSLNPLSAELVRGGVLEEGQGLSLSADLRRFDQQLGLAVGDTIAVTELDDGEFLGLVGETDREVEHWTDNRAIGLPPGGDTGQVLAKQTDDDYDVYWWSIPPLDAETVAGVGGILYNFENVGPEDGSWLYVQVTGDSVGVPTAWNQNESSVNFDRGGFHVNIHDGGDFVVSGGHDFIFYAPNALGYEPGSWSGRAFFLTYLGGGDFISYTQGGDFLIYTTTQDNRFGSDFIVYTDGTVDGGDQLFYPGTGDWLVQPYKWPGHGPYETAAPALQLFSAYSPLGSAPTSFTVSQSGDDPYDFIGMDFLGAYLHGGFVDIATTESGGTFGAGINLSSDTSIYAKALETLTLLSFDTAALGSIGGLLALSGEFGITYDIGDGVEHRFFSDDAGDLLRLYSDGSSFGLPPRGGSPGEVLVKASAGTYDMEWASVDAIGGILYNFLNVGPEDGSWLSVEATDVNPDTGYPVLFDVATDGNNNTGSFSPSPAFALIGGFVVRVVGGDDAGTFVGSAVDIENNSDASTIDGTTLYIREPGGTIIGHHDDMRVQGGTYAAGRKGYYASSGDAASLVADDVSVIGHDASSISGYRVYVQGGGDSSVIGLDAQATGVGENANVTGAFLSASATGASAFAWALQATAYGASGATVFSGLFGPGNFQVDLGAGEFFAVDDRVGTPILKIRDEGVSARSWLSVLTTGSGPESVYFGNVSQLYRASSPTGSNKVILSAGTDPDDEVTMGEIGLYDNQWIGYIPGGELIYTMGGNSARYTGGGDYLFYTFQGLSNSGDFSVYTGGSVDSGDVLFDVGNFGGRPAGDVTFTLDGGPGPATDSGIFQVQHAQQVYLYTAHTGPYLLLDGSGLVTYLYSPDTVTIESGGSTSVRAGGFAGIESVGGQWDASNDGGTLSLAGEGIQINSYNLALEITADGAGGRVLVTANDDDVVLSAPSGSRVQIQVGGAFYEFRDDGTIHGPTGGSIVWDL